MRAVCMGFVQLLRFVRRDKMLLAACLVPPLAGLFFKLGIPAAEKAAAGWLGTAVLAPYYGLLDLFFSMLAPAMFCFAAAMVVLEERDDHIDRCLFATPLGRKGYLLSRIAAPAAAALLITAVLLPVFKLTALSTVEIALYSLTGALQGVVIALLVVTLSSNKLEGMAVAKLATLTLLGALAPYFIPGRLQYAAGLLPSFWAGKAAWGREPFYLLPAALLALIWIFVLLRRFLRKLA